MKKYLFIPFAFLSLTLLAQNSGGPGPYGYSWYNSDHATNPANYNWIDIEAPENYVDGLGDDNIVGKIYKVIDFLALNVGKAKDKPGDSK